MSKIIRVAHSPDSDDAFMFYALAEGKLDTGDLHYVHELADIESLNQRARRAELEVTAVSIHAYAYLWRDYALLGSGSSMGDGYGPRLVSQLPCPADPRAALKGRRVAVPGKLTTAYLALQLFQPDCTTVTVPFDQIEDAVHRGEVGDWASHPRRPADLRRQRTASVGRSRRLVAPGHRSPTPSRRKRGAARPGPRRDGPDCP